MKRGIVALAIVLQIERKQIFVGASGDFELADVILQIDLEFLCAPERPRFMHALNVRRARTDHIASCNEQVRYTTLTEPLKLFHGFCVGRMMISLMKLFGS